MNPRLARFAEDLLDVDRGETTRFQIPIARRSSGEQLAVDVHVAAGVGDGPTLGLIAAVHGDAAYGSHAVRLIMQSLDVRALRGTVIGVPVANPVAFESGTRTTGQGWNTDMNNMNRVFPGLKGGWITQQMAYGLSTVVFPTVDAVIDYHCGSDTSINYTLVNGNRTPEQQRIFGYTRLMATDFIYVHDVDPFSGTIDQELKGRGKLCIVAEQGGHLMPEGFDELTVTRGHNFLKALGMLDGEPVLPDSQLLMRGGRTLQRIEHGGLFYPEAGVEALSTVVEGGSVLGRVIDANTFEEIQTIRAPYEQSAICMSRPAFGRVNPGDYAYIISDAGKGECVPRLSDWRISL